MIDGADSMAWLGLSPRALPQPFPYQGSKRALIRHLLSLFPADTGTLWEPFAGSAAVALATQKFRLARRVVISDLNRPLMHLWRMVIAEPELLVSGYAGHWNQQLGNPRKYYSDARAEFNRTGDPVLLLYLLCRCVKAAVRYNRRTGEFNQGADHRRLGVRPESLAQRIRLASEIMRETEVLVGGYEDFLLGAAPDDLVYLDPPYQGTSDVPDHRYLTGLSRDAFTGILGEANRKGISYLLSYDAHTADDRYGTPLPESLGLLHLNIRVGTSSQATLSGRSAVTYESIYVAPAVLERLGGREAVANRLEMLGA